jgi:hypothetical protein
MKLWSYEIFPYVLFSILVLIPLLRAKMFSAVVPVLKLIKSMLVWGSDIYEY